MFYFVLFLFKCMATTYIYTYCHTLSLHKALPICAVELGPLEVRCDYHGDTVTLQEPDRQKWASLRPAQLGELTQEARGQLLGLKGIQPRLDRKSTRLNSSH